MKIANVHGTPISLVYGATRIAPNLIWYGNVARPDMAVTEAIALLNRTVPNCLTGVQRFMLMARIQRAAKLGDMDAQRFVALCDLNITISTRH